MMDRTVVGQENSNRGETTALAGLLRDRKLVVVVEYPRWAERYKLVFNSPSQLSKGGKMSPTTDEFANSCKFLSNNTFGKNVGGVDCSVNF